MQTDLAQNRSFNMDVYIQNKNFCLFASGKRGCEYKFTLLGFLTF